MVVVLVVVWAAILGVSPGAALIAIPLAVLALDRYDPTLLDGFLRR
jgi:hypothetical protein